MVSYLRIIRQNISICWLWSNFPKSAWAGILLTVHGIMNLSIICFPLQPYSTAVKTVVYSRLTFVLVETHSFMIFVKFPIGFLKLILFWSLHWCSCHWWWEPPKTTVLISLPSEKVLTFSTVRITVVFFRFNLRPTVSLFLTHFISSIMSSLLSTSTVISSAGVMVFIFHVTFPKPVTISPTPPVYNVFTA